MQFIRFDNAAEFRDRAFSLLLRDAVENNLIIGIASRLAEDPAPRGSAGEAPALIATVEDDGCVAAAVLMTPPHNLLLTRATPTETEFAAARIHELGANVPGVLAPGDTADAFAATWARLTGRHARRAMPQRIYRLDRVIAPPRIPGVFTQATRDDLDLVVRWARTFHEEVLQTSDDVGPIVQQRLNRGDIYLWRNNGPVSMAASARPAGQGICINLVYTPPEHRRRGYASAVVATLSQHLLDSGRRWCALFTDLTNPTSNRLYQRIGYRPVCDFQEHRFDGGR